LAPRPASRPDFVPFVTAGRGATNGRTCSGTIDN
jgi:hypothetical protein